MADDARVYNGKLYTIKPVRDPWGLKPICPWAGYCDGDRIGFYRTKKEFWKAVEMITRQVRDVQVERAVRVEIEASLEGGKMLDLLHLFQGRHLWESQAKNRGNQR